MRAPLQLVLLLGARLATAYCPSPEPGGNTTIAYGKTYVQFLELAGQARDRYASLTKKVRTTEDPIESYSMITLMLKQQNADLRCAQNLMELFLSNKKKGIEASASTTQSWIVAMILSNEQLIDEMRTALSSDRPADAYRLVDKFTDHRVRSDGLWEELPKLAVITTYAFVDLDGDPNSKTDSLNITASERKQLISMLTTSFPGILTNPKEGRFPPEAGAWILQVFLNKPGMKSAPTTK